MKSESPEEWAQILKEEKDYRSLAAINNSQDYRKEFQKFRKRDIANRILREVGTDAVNSILEELATEDVGRADLANLLVDIGDPKAVPLMKKSFDRGKFNAYGSRKRIRDFVQKHPDLHEDEETGKCALCEKTRKVTEMRSFRDVSFCKETCWNKRGLVVGDGIGKDCPFYSEGMCKAGEGSSLCSLQAGHYSTACYVYGMHG